MRSDFMALGGLGRLATLPEIKRVKNSLTNSVVITGIAVVFMSFILLLLFFTTFVNRQFDVCNQN